MDRSRTNYLYSTTHHFPFSQIHFSTNLLPYTRSRTTSNSKHLQTLSAHPSWKPLHYYHGQLLAQNALSKSTKLLNNHQIHWIEILSPFDFEILYIPSSKNIIADTLSHLHEKDPSPPSSPNTSSSPPVISKMDDEQYP